MTDRQRIAQYAEICGEDGFTYEEVMNATGIHPCSITARLSEMTDSSRCEDDVLLVRLHRKRAVSSGKLAHVYLSYKHFSAMVDRKVKAEMEARANGRGA